MQVQGNAGRARKLKPENRSKGLRSTKPSQETVDELLKKVGQSGTEKARSTVPSQATQNPRTPVAPAPARSPQPLLQSPAPRPQALPQTPAIAAQSTTCTEEQEDLAVAEVEALLKEFKYSGTFPGDDLKAICAAVPEADIWFADALDELKTQLPKYPCALAAFEWMRLEIARAAYDFLRNQQSPEAVVDKWEGKLGKLAVTRTYIREMNKLVPALSCRTDVRRDPYA